MVVMMMIDPGVDDGIDDDDDNETENGIEVDHFIAAATAVSAMRVQICARAHFEPCAQRAPDRQQFSAAAAPASTPARMPAPTPAPSASRRFQANGFLMQVCGVAEYSGTRPE